MSRPRTCPVCGRPGLPPNCASCPQCDADLTCFQALDSLAGPAAAQEHAAGPVEKRTPWAAAALLAALVFLLLAGLAASMKSRLSELDRELAAMRAERDKQRQGASFVAETAAKSSEGSAIHPEGPPRIPDAQPDASKTEQQGGAAGKAQGKLLTEAAAPGEAEPSTAPKPPASSGLQQESGPEAAPAEKAEQEKQVADAPEKVVKELILADAEEEKDGTAAVAAAQPQAEENGKDPVRAASEEVAAVSLPAEHEEAQDGLAALPELPPVEIAPAQQRKRRVPQPVQPAAAAGAEEKLPAEERQSSAVLAGSVFSYSAKEGETVRDIAQRFYGDRKYYPVVMELNPHVFLGFIRRSSDLWIFADRREAAALYQRRIEQKDGLLLWNYEVRPGETWRSIYARFFLPSHAGAVFYGSQDVAPGKTVQVILR